MKNLPKEINIIGITYKIIYVDNPVDVDYKKRESLWGQIDPWTATIRIYKYENASFGSIFQTIMHEVLHGIIEAMKIEPIKEDEITIDQIARGLTDVLLGNNFIEWKGKI